MKRIALFIATIALTSSSLLAWGQQGHLLNNEAATLTLPNDMPAFFYRAFPQLTYLGPEPDRWKGPATLDAVNLPDHFIDSEYADGLQLPPLRYDFVALMLSSGRIRSHGLTIAETGFLPWRIAELGELLTVQFRMWRASAPGSAERKAIEINIIHIAGVLGHFTGDSANPHHTTRDFNGWAESTNPNHYRYDCETHSRFESAFVSRTMRIEQIVPLVSAPSLRTNYFAEALSMIARSHAQLNTLYRIDRDGGFDAWLRPTEEAEHFAAERIAAGASFTRDMWWSAWRNSKPQPRKPASTAAPVD
jgi:hypothetical protein